MRKYEQPNIRIIITKKEDVITLSNGGTASGPGEEYKTGTVEINSIDID
jgi:hypothetical protein